MKKFHILIVEDEPIIGIDIKTCLNGLADSLELAASFEEALKQINLQKPDLALLDICLKGKADGIELAKILKMNFQIPFIFIAAFGIRNIEEALTLSPMAIVKKPFLEADLLNTIEKAKNFITYNNLHIPSNDRFNLI